MVQGWSGWAGSGGAGPFWLKATKSATSPPELAGSAEPVREVTMIIRCRARQQSLTRAGWRLVDAYPSRWNGDPVRAALELTSP